MAGYMGFTYSSCPVIIFELYSNITEHYIYNKNIICQIDSLTRLQSNKFDVVIDALFVTFLIFCNYSIFRIHMDFVSMD